MAIVRDVIIFCRDLKNRSISDIVIIHVQELRRVIPCSVTLVCVQSQRAESSDIVRLIQQRDVWDEQRIAKKIDIIIEIVVDHVETVASICDRKVRWALGGARE